MHYAGVIAHSGHSGHSITCVTELIRDLAVTGLTGIQTGPDWKKKAKKKKMVSPGACGVLARPGPSVQLAFGQECRRPQWKVDTMLTGLLLLLLLAEKLKS